MSTLQEDKYIFISCSFLLRMRNVSDKSCRENENTHFPFNNFSKNRTVYETMWKICTARQATDHNMAHAYCILDT